MAYVTQERSGTELNRPYARLAGQAGHNCTIQREDHDLEWVPLGRARPVSLP